MPIENLQFRPAQADDVEAVVPLIYSSGSIAFDYVFASHKGNAEVFLHHAFQDGAGEFGYCNHVVGIMDGNIVCTGAGFTGETGMAFTLAAIRQIIRFYGVLRGISVMLHGLQMEALIHPPAKDLYYIGHLGVSPDLRGQGIGTELIKHLLLPEYTQGRSTAVLDVAVSNPRAEALYARMGFVVTKLCKSNLSSQWGAVVDHRRMEKPL